MLRATSLALMLSLGACSATGAPGSEHPAAEPSVVEATASAQSPSPSAAAEWVEPAAYSFTLESRCGERMLIGRFHVEVENGSVVNVDGLDDQGRTAAGVIQPQDVPTLAALLDLVDEARSDGAARVNLSTDPVDAHPVEVEIDWQANAIDDEECYSISDFVAAG